MLIRNFFKHLNMVNKHRFLVFKYSLSAGIPLRGLLHDLSKYSPSEFLPGVKYYTDGKKSPIITQRIKEGYSKAWLHHKGRNKHHFEYWYDFNATTKTPSIPYKYVIEMVCDSIAASKTYLGKNWTPESQIKYFNNRKDLQYLNEDIKKFLIQVYEDLIKNGLDKTINKKYLKETYYKYIKD